MESFNPTGSVKDRVARALIEDAEERVAIGPGQTILEPTSGNTGISLAMICSRKGYRLKVVMPDNVTPERTQLLQMYGADIVYSPGNQGSNGAVAMALEMAKDPQYYMPYQYGNDANPRAHYNGTAPEILEELPGNLTAFVVDARFAFSTRVHSSGVSSPGGTERPLPTLQTSTSSRPWRSATACAIARHCAGTCTSTPTTPGTSWRWSATTAAA